MVDPNPVLDEGNSLSSGGLRAAAALCDVIGIRFNFDPAQLSYSRGCGDKALGSKPVLCYWTLSL